MKLEEARRYFKEKKNCVLWLNEAQGKFRPDIKKVKFVEYKGQGYLFYIDDYNDVCVVSVHNIYGEVIEEWRLKDFDWNNLNKYCEEIK